MLDLSTRHPGTQQLMRFFLYAHPYTQVPQITDPVCALAEAMVATLPDSTELTVGLRKLLEARDAFARAAQP